MNNVSFTFDDKNSIYINTQKNGAELTKAPIAEYSKNILDWEISNGAVLFSQQEIALMDNPGNEYISISEMIHVDQQSVGDIVFRALVKAEDVPGNIGYGWELNIDVCHHDETWEYNKKLHLPPGKYPWWQFSFQIHSDAGKTIKWVCPYLMIKNRKGKAQFRLLEVIDLTDTALSTIGEAYSRPECIYGPMQLDSPKSGLKLDLLAFAYSNLANINQKDSPAHSIAVLSKFPYLICGEPDTLNEREKYVIDTTKNTVKVFGHVTMGGNPLPDMALLKASVDRIAAEGWYGVFWDRFGYDHNETRARQNEIVDYTHVLGLKCFANGRNIDDVLSDVVDPICNPDGTPPRLGTGDWILLEDFLVNNGGYIPDMYLVLEKYSKAMFFKNNLGINVGCLSYQRNDTTWEQAASDATLSYLLALAHGFNGWWFVNTPEDDSFLYRPDPNLNTGNTLLGELRQISPYWYMAETDNLIIIFSTEASPPLTYQVYQKSRRRPLPAGKTILYSDDLAAWQEYNQYTPYAIGNFVREKKVII